MTTLKPALNEPTVTGVDCPSCHAKPGAPCKTEGGRPTDPHAPRKELHALHITELRRLRAWNEACQPKGSV